MAILHTDIRRMFYAATGPIIFYISDQINKNTKLIIKLKSLEQYSDIL